MDTSGLDSIKRDSRVLFANLPAYFQRKANFGNDIITRTSAVKAIIRNEKKILGPEGSFVVFDNNGFHRGNQFLKKHQRIIIQLIFEPVY